MDVCYCFREERSIENVWTEKIVHANFCVVNRKASGPGKRPHKVRCCDETGKEPQVDDGGNMLNDDAEVE